MELDFSIFDNFPASDSEWTDDHWRQLITFFLDSGFVTPLQLASLMLGHINPPQVGTSIASNASFQAHYEKGKTMRAVMDWFYEQEGECVDCKTKFELQADHIIPKEELGDAANTLDNMTLRCRRCNVIKRPSHKNGGKTFLTAEAGLMWILFTKRPSQYQEFEKLCREYGMTMANIRFQEAWAMARWLHAQGLYNISEDSKY